MDSIQVSQLCTVNYVYNRIFFVPSAVDSWAAASALMCRRLGGGADVERTGSGILVREEPHMTSTVGRLICTPSESFSPPPHLLQHLLATIFFSVCFS